MISPKSQRLAQRLLALEGARDAAPDEATNVAVRVIEQLCGRLSRLAGVHGYRALFSRALTLAKQDDLALAGVRISEDGALINVAAIEKSEGAGLFLVAQLLDLLITFIGESLTLQLVRDAWPEAAPEVAPEAASEEKS